MKQIVNAIMQLIGISSSQMEKKIKRIIKNGGEIIINGYILEVDEYSIRLADEQDNTIWHTLKVYANPAKPKYNMFDVVWQIDESTGKAKPHIIDNIKFANGSNNYGYGCHDALLYEIYDSYEEAKKHETSRTEIKLNEKKEKLENLLSRVKWLKAEIETLENENNMKK